ncbi:MAG TPA: ABC transporter permease [Thermomicrobiaceae bacterium]|nr:ABC transporter permease [Thermomicrobiaceae bacterium]
MIALANTATGRDAAGALEPVVRPRLVSAITDALLVARRQLIHMRRIPMELVGYTAMPVMFVVLFRYVFAGAITVGGGVSYVNFLMAGIFVQSIAFSGPHTGITLAHDLQKGLIDRFRSLPMAPSAVLVGQTLADTFKAAISVVVMVGVGLAVGFRPGANLPEWLAAIGIMLLFTYAMSWLGATIALVVGTPESVDQILMTMLFPLTFASSAFVPVATMPGWLQGFTRHQPVSIVVNAVRALLLGQPVGNAGWQATVWCLAILLVAMPLALRLYHRTTSR